MFPWNIFLEIQGNAKLMYIQQRSNLLKTLNEAFGSIRGEVGVAAQNLARCTSQQKVDTFFIFYILKTEHSTPYIVLVSNSLMSMQVFLH